MTAYGKFSKMKYRIPEPGTTISGFADSKKKKKKKLMPTDPRFFWHVIVNTHIFSLVLQWPALWKISENKTQYQIWKER